MDTERRSQRPRRRLWVFGLRGLLHLMLWVGLFLAGWQARTWRDQQLEAQRQRELFQQAHRNLPAALAGAPLSGQKCASCHSQATPPAGDFRLDLGMAR